MQGWIKQKSYKRNHARKKQDVELPVHKKARLTPWQIFLKEYGKSAGKLHWIASISLYSTFGVFVMQRGRRLYMLDGVGAVNKVASSAYRKAISDNNERERLANVAASTDDNRTMTSSDIRRAGAKTFKRVWLVKLFCACSHSYHSVLKSCLPKVILHMIGSIGSAHPVS